VGGWAADLALALDLVDAADEVTMRRFLAVDLAVEAKPDLTPVSDADRSVETLVRDRLASARPDDAVVGEEYGATGVGERRWIVDPVDGTKNFVRGAPVWATLLALQVRDEVVLGVVSAPRRCSVSKVATLDDAFVSYSSLDGWEKQGRLDGLLDLSRRVWRTRAFGDFWSHLLVAEGAVDASFEPEVSLWDLAALQPIVEEAGGRFTDLSGVDRADGGSAVCSNGLLHDDVLAALAAR
jgi:histidinol-phosphatase